MEQKKECFTNLTAKERLTKSHNKRERIPEKKKQKDRTLNLTDQDNEENGGRTIRI
jgi:hypothetical protein